jgi:periplasmic mercuric ion binding protein
MCKLLLTSFALATLVAAPAWAAPQTVTLAVSKMTCAACPITVKTALSRVPGVTSVSVSFEKKQATVAFDDAKTTVAALTRATTDAGYPSTAAKGAGK